MCILMVYMYITKQVNKFKQVSLLKRTNGCVKICTLDKIGTNLCEKAKIRQNKPNGKFWNTYKYITMYIFVIYMYITKLVNKPKYVSLPKRANGFVKPYTLVKIGTELCQMLKIRLYKSRNKFRNGFTYIKACIMEIRARIHELKSWKPPVIPLGIGYKRRSQTKGCQIGSIRSHPW